MVKVGTLKRVLTNSYFHKKKKDAPSSIDGYHIDPALSGRRAQVYVDDDGNAIVSHRGTDDLSDVWTDLKYAAGFTKGKRFKHAEKVQRAAEKKYGTKNITTVGHSLGAALAEKVGKDSKQVITLNKPVRPQDLGKRRSKRQIDIRTTGDPISQLDPFQKSRADVVIKSKYYNPLKEHTIDVLDRLDSKEEVQGSGLRPRWQFPFSVVH